MIEASVSTVVGWESFYVIVGSSAAALTGLQFVVIALVAEVSNTSGTNEVAAYGTPTVVHFCLALLTASALSAPWKGLAPVAFVLGAVGLGGLGYAAIVIRRARRATGYRPVFEDWLWHTILPIIAYGSILGGAIGLSSHSENSLFFVGAATLLLVFIGIHNAWDTVTYLAVTRIAASRKAAGHQRAEDGQLASTTASAPKSAPELPANAADTPAAAASAREST